MFSLFACFSCILVSLAQFFTSDVSLTFIERVCAIFLQLILLTLCLVALLPSTNIDFSIIIPQLSMSTPSPLFVSLSRIALPSWDIRLGLLWSDICCVTVWFELTFVRMMSGSALLHICIQPAITISFEAWECSIVELSMLIEHTYSLEWVPLFIRVLILNECRPNGDALVLSAQWHSRFYHFHLCIIIIIPFAWMKHFVLEFRRHL